MLNPIDTAPYQLVEPHKEIATCWRCDRYTPSIVAKLREGLIMSHAQHLMQTGMTYGQARIVAEGQLQSWENMEFEQDCG